MSKIDYFLSGIDQEGNMALELTLMAEQAFEILSQELVAGRARIVAAEGHPLIAPSIPVIPKKSIKPGNVVKIAKKKIGKGPTKEKKTRKRGLSEEKIKEIESMFRRGMTHMQIVQETGIAKSALYARFPKSKNQPRAPRTPAVEKSSPAEAPEKEGERDIDKTVPLTLFDWEEIKSSFNDGMALGMLRISYPRYDLPEMKRAMDFDTYEEYQKHPPV